MKKCSKYKELFVDGMYGDLSAEEHTHLRDHLESCPTCAEEYEQMRGVLTIMDKRERPQPFQHGKDDFWDRLEARLDSEEAAPKGPLKHPWKIYYPLSAAALVIIGILIGKTLYSPVNTYKIPGIPGKQGQTINQTNNVNPALARHFDNMKPLLLDYANYSPGEETQMIEKETLKKLMLENFLLKRAIAKKGDKPLQVLLEELELVLLEMSGMSNENPGDSYLIQDLIKENDIIFKMSVQDKKNKNNTFTRL